MCPEVKVLFGFPADIDPHCEELVKSKRFAFHATFLMEMMERTVEMLGDENDKLTEALTELGKKHVVSQESPRRFGSQLSHEQVSRCQNRSGRQ
jgi:hypothetical protein